MLFDSYIFIFAFLPVCLLSYALLTRFKHYYAAIVWLVMASLFFYGWWDPKYLLLLLTSITLNFFLGFNLWKQAKQKRDTRLLLFVGVSMNLLFIAYFKYAYFLISNLNIFLNTPVAFDPIILPLGISFFTFQKIAFLVDASRGEIDEYRFSDYCLFVTFFPQLIAGPIVQHKHIIPQLAKHSNLRVSSENLSIGLTLFFIGLFKKIVLADSVAVYANAVFNAASTNILLTFWEAWGGALAYTLQLYFDFSGYSDMAIGLGYMFGLKLPLNFFSPYQARNIIDFWRRWHMTLSHFLRDYLYIPLGGNRKGETRRLLNLMITMLLGGLWHGANWTFVLWGAMHGAYLIINHSWQKVMQSLGLSNFKSRGFELLSRALTLTAVVVAWVPFRADTLSTAKLMLSRMFSYDAISLPNFVLQKLGIIGSHYTGLFYNGLADWIHGIYWISALLGIALFMPNTAQFIRNHFSTSDAIASGNRMKFLAWAPSKSWAFITALIIIISLILVSDESEFLYFQF